jgi:hypothetical protein
MNNPQFQLMKYSLEEYCINAGVEYSKGDSGNIFIPNLSLCGETFSIGILAKEEFCCIEIHMDLGMIIIEDIRTEMMTIINDANIGKDIGCLYLDMVNGHLNQKTQIFINCGTGSVSFWRPFFESMAREYCYYVDGFYHVAQTAQGKMDNIFSDTGPITEVLEGA